MSDEPAQHRFLTVEQAAEELNVKLSLIRGLIKAGELRAIQIGGRGYLGQILQSRRFHPALVGMVTDNVVRFLCGS